MIVQVASKQTAAVAALLFLGACALETAPDQPTGFQPTEPWVRAYYELFHAEHFEVDRLMEYYAPGVHFVDPTFDIDVTGLEEVRQLYAGIGTAESSYSNMRWALDRIIIGGTSDVVIHGTWSGSFRASPFEIQFVTLWRLEDGRIVEQKDFFDAPTFDEQVGWKEG